MGLLFIAPLSTQNHEVRASTGFITTADFGDLIVETITIGSYSTDNMSNSSSIGIEYWHSQGKVIQLGGRFSHLIHYQRCFFFGRKDGKY